MFYSLDYDHTHYEIFISLSIWSSMRIVLPTKPLFSLYTSTRRLVTCASVKGHTKVLPVWCLASGICLGSFGSYA